MKIARVLCLCVLTSLMMVSCGGDDELGVSAPIPIDECLSVQETGGYHWDWWNSTPPGSFVVRTAEEYAAIVFELEEPLPPMPEPGQVLVGYVVSSGGCRACTGPIECARYTGDQTALEVPFGGIGNCWAYFEWRGWALIEDRGVPVTVDQVGPDDC